MLNRSAEADNEPIPADLRGRVGPKRGRSNGGQSQRTRGG